MGCPDRETLAAFGRGGLASGLRDGVEHHLRTCDACREAVSELAPPHTPTEAGSVDGHDEPVPSSDETLVDDSIADAIERSPREHGLLEPGARLDRYHILEPVGRGGMGVVYAAYDSDLDRKVALKVLKDQGVRGQARGQRRMVREAQAMARLSHPNVITVHEVRDMPQAPGQVFISMEFVEGGTLGRWLAEHAPERDRVLAMFRGIGRGLAAAHAVGLVHSDVKPDNVLIGADERPRVTDFGLARLVDDQAGLEPGAGQEGTHVPTGSTGDALPSPRALDATLSRTKGLVGTPAYMAPEQLMREPPTAASDQFSFCVALYEALWGQRPFAGRTFAALAHNVLAGALAEPERDPGVPRWLRQVVLRGLSRDPADRWPSMDVLVERLEAGPLRTRRRLLASGAVALVLVTAISLANRGRSAPPDPCASGDRSMQALWSRNTRGRVQDTLAQGSTPYAEQTAALAVERLDEYTDRWAASHRDACEAYQRGDQSDEAFDLRGACLEERRRELDALVSVLVEAEPEVRRHAIEAIDELRPLTPCEDLEALRSRVPPPDDPEIHERVRAVDQSLARVRALRQSGRYEAGITLADETTEAARTTGHTPVIARTLRERARLHESLRADEAALRDLQEAWPMALAAGDDALAAETAVDLVFVQGWLLQHFALAEQRIPDAEAMIERVHRHDPQHAEDLRGELLMARAQTELRQHHYEAAIALQREALQIAERRAGADSLRVGRMLNGLASALLAKGDWEEALTMYRRVLAIRTQHLGAAHPEIGHAHNNVGLALRVLQRFEEAEAELLRAQQILRAALGPEHPSIAMVRANLGEVLYSVRRYGEAADHYVQAYDTITAEEITHEQLLRRVWHYGTSLGRSGRHDRAREILTMSLERAEALDQPATLRVSLTELARLDLAAADPQRALATLERLPPERSHAGFEAEVAFLHAAALLLLGREDEARARLPLVHAAPPAVAGAPSAAEVQQLERALDGAGPPPFTP